MSLNIKGLHHDHIDGSNAVLDVWEELNILAGKPKRFATHDDLRNYFTDVHNDLVGKFGAVTELLQSEEAIELLGHAYGHRRAVEGYTYVEAKFAPQYSLREGLTLKKATAAMCRGLWKAQSKYGIKILPQLCIGREAKPELGIEIAKLALDYDGLVGLDLACVEPGDPPEKHLPAYKLTFGSKVKRDCHAGEWVEAEPKSNYRARLLKNVHTAVHVLKCDGVGQAIPLIDDMNLVDYMVDNGIRAAMCPLSNLALGCIKKVRDLKIATLLDTGLILTINPDDDLIFPSLNKVIEVCDRAYTFTNEQKVLLESNVFRGAFLEEVRY